MKRFTFLVCAPLPALRSTTVMGFIIAYTVVLIMPAWLGKAVDESDGSFSGGMTAIGGRAVRLRAAATMDWIAAAGLGTGGVCEIGPGRGVVAREADRRGYLYFAIDCDPAAIVRVRHIATETCVAKVPPIPDCLPPMNAFVCENVLEHMSGYAEARDLIRAFHDGLYSGGVLVMRFPEARYTKWGFWENAQDHQYVTTLRRVTMLCRECGFRIEWCGHSFDHIAGARGWAVYQAKRCFPWRFMHNLFYEPWMTSPWSKLAEKVPHCYVVAVKGESHDIANTQNPAPAAERAGNDEQDGAGVL